MQVNGITVVMPEQEAHALVGELVSLLKHYSDSPRTRAKHYPQATELIHSLRYHSEYVEPQ